VRASIAAELGKERGLYEIFGLAMLAMLLGGFTRSRGDLESAWGSSSRSSID
jgi:hypothetical protein